jgi:phosphatidylserine/phosphatidylglycerophosphate/cardiolipin synthase-like enzyme
MTRRSIVVALVAGLALALLMHTAPTRTVPAAQRLLDYTPATGATFNRPVGTQAEQRAIFRHINNTIDATPPGATIRFAVYSFAEKATATRLINAHQRGVNVQMIFNKHTVYPQETRLQRALGTNAAKRSFAIFCEKSCRGDKGNMHQKVFLFSKAGQAENIVMVGSNNMTRNNAVNQWSDVYTVADDPALYFTYSGVFEQMKADRAQLRPYIAATVNDYGPEFYPYPRVTQANDPLYQALSKITCTGAAEGYGTETTVDADEDGVLDRVTALRLSQHAWNGDRGIYLAQKVSELKRAGCDVKVIAGVGFGRVVKNTLIRNKVPMNPGKVKGKHTHQKAFFVSGVFDGDPASARVWTGSHNWSDGALRRDDAVLEVTGLDAYNQYAANFEDIWLNG